METLTRPRKVLRAQLPFFRSQALYRGFVGGRGSGKTWAGAYDLLRRAKRGHTYLVASPTGVLLHDTTFPTFKAIAQEIGIWGPVRVVLLPEVVLTPTGESQVKLTPYPTVKLTTGATVRFRTAEDPEKMRGPNLSGVWLDEASLMDVEAFRVSIACLREKGEQGWLSATFTPCGFSHWTYKTFATGQPDTFLIHGKTRDNVFNPPGFATTLAQQYSPLRQRQELEGEFVNLEGAEWPPEYFEAVLTSEWPTRFRACALALDPALGKGEREKACYAAFAFAGVDDVGVIWADAWLRQDWDAAALVARGFELCSQLKPGAFAVETNGGQQFLAELYLQECRRTSRVLPLYGLHNFEDKEVRIRAKLGPFLAQRRLRIRDSAGGKLLLQQTQEFPVGQYRDAPDALQMALVMLDYLLFGQQSSGAQPQVLRA